MKRIFCSHPSPSPLLTSLQHQQMEIISQHQQQPVLTSDQHQHQHQHNNIGMMQQDNQQHQQPPICPQPPISLEIIDDQPEQQQQDMELDDDFVFNFDSDEIVDTSHVDPFKILEFPSEHHKYVARHVIKSESGNLEFEMTLPTRYEPAIDQSTGCVRILGQGGYGVVVACHDKELNKLVAIKMIKNVFNNGAPYRMLREMKIMRYLRPHPNIIELIDVFVNNNTNNNGGAEYCLENFKELYIVMGLMEDGDLKVFLNNLHKKKKAITMDFIRTVMHQLLCGMQYMQSFGVLHRDMKPANVLLSAQQSGGVNVRISDFGLSNIDSDNPGKNSKSLYVVTRYYRPPEVVLQYGVQNSSIDSWGLGCIFAELLYMLPPKPMRRPLFAVNSTGREISGISEHLNLITSLLGKAKPEDIKGSEGSREWYAQQFSDHSEEGIAFNLIFPSANEESLDLLQQFLQWNPEKRITFSQALNHSFFKDVSNINNTNNNNSNNVGGNSGSGSLNIQPPLVNNSPLSSSSNSKAITFNFEKDGDISTMKFLYYHEMCRIARSTSKC